MCILSKYKPYKVIFVSENMLGYFWGGINVQKLEMIICSLEINGMKINYKLKRIFIIL